MIWLACRQHRKQALATVIGLALLAALMIPSGLTMHHAFADAGLDRCVRALGGAELVPNVGEGCGAGFEQFISRFQWSPAEWCTDLPVSVSR